MKNTCFDRHRMVKKAISVLTLLVFIFNFVLTDAWAVVTDPSTGSYSHEAGKFSQLDVGTFTIPQDLGIIKYSGKGDPNKVIIHIQDAHCNYAAQKKISKIIEYLNEEYGIGLVNLEGGTGEYDLSIFTGIYDGGVREGVADYFLKWGLVNGAEFFALNNPDKVTLWGVEDTGLYLKNLDVYQDSLNYKDEVDRYLKQLNHVLNNLKMHIFPKELLELDSKYGQYRAENVEFKDYMLYLLAKAKQKGINIRNFPNIYLLSQSLEQEEKIDFKKASNERDALVDRLKEVLSRKELKELVSKTVEFRNKRISQNDFYDYLIRKAKQTSQDLEDFPELRKYIIYVSLYNAVDKTRIMQEIETLEKEIKETIYTNDKQRELDLLSKNLILTNDIFDISFTKNDYRYYKKNRSAFDVHNYLSFIKREAPTYGITAKLDKNITRLDEYREKIFNFYEYSFKRDGFFLKNIKFGGDKVRSGIFVTGGFHAENLLELFKENNISYISIIPNFRDEEGYECPYFDVLSGGMSPLEKSIEAALSSIQVASLCNALGVEASDPERAELFRMAVLALRSVYEAGEPQAIGLDDGKFIVFAIENGDPVCRMQDTPGKAQLVTEEKFGRNVANLVAVFSEVAQDRIIRHAEREYLGEESDIVKEAMDGLPEGSALKAALRDLLAKKSYVDETGRTRAPPGYTGVQIVEGLLGAHAAQAIYLPKNATAATLIHELVAGMYAGTDRLDSHGLAEAVEGAFRDRNLGAMEELLASARLHAVEGENKAVWDMTADQRRRLEARDYAAVLAAEREAPRRTGVAEGDKDSLLRALDADSSRLKPFFDSLSPTEEKSVLDAIMQRGDIVKKKEGEDFIKEGEKDQVAYFVFDGQYKVRYTRLSGPAEVETAYLSREEGGDLVGEMALVRGGRRSATVFAMTDLKALRLSANTLNEIFWGNPGLRKKFDDSLYELIEQRQREKERAETRARAGVIGPVGREQREVLNNLFNAGIAVVKETEGEKSFTDLIEEGFQEEFEKTGVRKSDIPILKNLMRDGRVVLEINAGKDKITDKTLRLLNLKTGEASFKDILQLINVQMTNENELEELFETLKLEVIATDDEIRSAAERADGNALKRALVSRIDGLLEKYDERGLLRLEAPDEGRMIRGSLIRMIELYIETGKYENIGDFVNLLGFALNGYVSQKGGIVITEKGVIIAYGSGGNRLRASNGAVHSIMNSDKIDILAESYNRALKEAFDDGKITEKEYNNRRITSQMLLETRFAMAIHDAMAGNKRNANAGLGIFGEIDDLKEGHGVAATKYLAPRIEALRNLFGDDGIDRITNAIAYHDNTDIDFSTRDKTLLTMIGIADNTAAAEKFMDAFTKVPGNEGLIAKLHDLEKICDPESPEQYSRLLKGIRNKLIENIEKAAEQRIINEREAAAYKYTVINDLNAKTATMGLGAYNAGAFVSDRVACEFEVNEAGEITGTTMTVVLQRSNFDKAFSDLFGEELSDEHLRKITAKPYGKKGDSVKAGEKIEKKGLVMNIEARRVRPGRYNRQDINTESLVKAAKKAHANVARQLRKNRGNPEAQLKAIQGYFDITKYELGSIIDAQRVSKRAFIRNFINEVLPGEFGVSEKEREQRREILKRARKAVLAGKARVIEEKPVVEDTALIEFIREVFGRHSSAVLNYLKVKGWTVNTVETIGEEGVVDIENKKLYLTREARTASMVAPVIIPTLIFSEVLRTGRMPRELEGGLLDRLLGRNLVDNRLLKGRNISSLDIEAAVWAADGTEEGNEKLSDLLVRSGRVWYVFADGIAGRGREKAFGSNIMDRLSAEATETALRFAAKNGIFAYKFGGDEHVFIFPETYAQNQVENFLLEILSELRKGSRYAVYDMTPLNETEGKSKEKIDEDREKLVGFIAAAEEAAEAKGTEAVSDIKADLTRIAVEESVAEELDRNKEWRALRKYRKYMSPFLMQAVAVRATADSARLATADEALAAAEAMVEKWRDDEVKNMTDKQRAEIWDHLLIGEQEVIAGRARDRISQQEAEKLKKSGRDMEGHQKVLHGLPGINKKIVSVEGEVNFAKRPVAVSGKDMLKEIEGVDWEADRLSMKERMEMGIKPYFDRARARAEAEVVKAETAAEAARTKARISRTSRARAEADGAEARAERARRKAAKVHRMIDAYTSYDADALKDLLGEILKMPRAERAKLPLGERVLMVRGPPVDFFIVLINRDGAVYVLNVDMMCHAGVSGRSPEVKKRVENELRELLAAAGRRTDYVITHEGEEVWMFPFKALNSYLESHELADNYIRATSVTLLKAFSDMFNSEQYGGKNNIDRDGIIEAIRVAAQKANNSIDTRKFREVTGGKERINIALETHLVPVESIVPEGQVMAEEERIRQGEMQARGALHRLDAMRSVRAADIVRKDGDIYSTDTGELAARVRIYSDDSYVEYQYEREFNRKEKSDAERGYKEIVERGILGGIDIDRAKARLRTEIPGEEKLPQAEKRPLDFRRFAVPAAGILLAVPLVFLSAGAWAVIGAAGGYLFVNGIALAIGRYRAVKAFEQIFRKYSFERAKIPYAIRYNIMKKARKSPRERYKVRKLAERKNRVVRDLIDSRALGRGEAAVFVVSVLEDADSLEDMWSRLDYIGDTMNALSKIGIRSESERRGYLEKIFDIDDFRKNLGKKRGIEPEDQEIARKKEVERRLRRLRGFNSIFSVLQPDVINAGEVRDVLRALLEGANNEKSRPLVNALGAAEEKHIEFLGGTVPNPERFLILNNMIGYYGKYGREMDKEIAAGKAMPVNEYLSRANSSYIRHGRTGISVETANTKEEVFGALLGSDPEKLGREYVRRLLASKSVDLEELRSRIAVLANLGINIYGGKGVYLLDRKEEPEIDREAAVAAEVKIISIAEKARETRRAVVEGAVLEEAPAEGLVGTIETEAIMRPEAAPGLIGKLYGRDGQLLTSGFLSEEKEGKLVMSHAEMDSPITIGLAAEQDISKEKITASLKEFISPKRPNTLTPEETAKINALIEAVDSARRVVALEDNENVLGHFGSNGVLYLNRNLIGNPLAFLHELGEGNIELPEGYDALTRHTYMRGVGKDARSAFDVLVADGAAMDDMTDKQFVDALEGKMKEMGLRSMTDSEKDLVRYNFALKHDPERKYGVFGAETLLFGLQDHMDPAGNLTFTRNIRGLVDSLRRGCLNIILIPSLNVETIAGQEKYARKAGRRFRESGVNTRVTHFDTDLEEQLKKAIDETAAEKNKKLLPKIFIYCLTEQDKTMAEKFQKQHPYLIVIGNDISEELGADEIQVDEVRVVAVASTILNDKRLREDFGLTPQDLIESRLSFLIAFNTSGILNENLEGITAEGLERIMQRLYTGDIALRITRVNWEEIRDWEDAQEEVLRSL